MTLLSVRGLSAFYGSFQALFDVSLEAGGGRDGGGHRRQRRRQDHGAPHDRGRRCRCPPPAVHFDGAPVGGRPAHELVDRGIVLVPEGRRIFPSLTVEENLLVGAYRGRPGRWTLARVYELFPVLAERRRQPGTNLSGGEQQMLAIGRGLMANPRLLLVDEISLGLAPLVVQGLYRVLRTIAAEGTTTLVVDQNVSQILPLAQRVYCLRKGAVSLEGRPAELTRARIAAAYFGVGV